AMTQAWQVTRSELLASGWQLAARGDWAWVYRSADGTRAARLCPYDPAHRLFVRACRRHAGNPYLPTVLDVCELVGGGELVITPGLEPVEEREAAELAAHLGFATAAGAKPGSHAESFAGREESPALRELRQFLLRLIAEGEHALPFFGGIDLHAANVRRD